MTPAVETRAERIERENREAEAEAAAQRHQAAERRRAMRIEKLRERRAPKVAWRDALVRLMREYRDELPKQRAKLQAERAELSLHEENALRSAVYELETSIEVIEIGPPRYDSLVDVPARLEDGLRAAGFLPPRGKHSAFAGRPSLRSVERQLAEIDEELAKLEG